MSKSIFNKFLPLHKPDKVAVQHLAMSSIFTLVTLFGFSPHALNVISCCSSVRIHKIVPMIDSQVLISMFLKNIIRWPTVRHNRCAWQNELLNNWQKSFSGAIGYFYQKTITRCWFISPKDPLRFDSSANIVLGLTNMLSLISTKRPGPPI